jgi:acyl carrier protein
MTPTREILVAAIAGTLGILPGGIADDQTLSDLGADTLHVFEIARLLGKNLKTTAHLLAAFQTDYEPTVSEIAAAIDALIAGAS